MKQRSCGLVRCAGVARVLFRCELWKRAQRSAPENEAKKGDRATRSGGSGACGFDGVEGLISWGGAPASARRSIPGGCNSAL